MLREHMGYFKYMFSVVFSKFVHLFSYSKQGEEEEKEKEEGEEEEEEEEEEGEEERHHPAPPFSHPKHHSLHH